MKGEREGEYLHLGVGRMSLGERRGPRIGGCGGGDGGFDECCRDCGEGKRVWLQLVA